MEISPISFGKVIRVDAPLNITEKLATLCKSEEDTQIAKDLKRIFDDRDNNKIKAYGTLGVGNYLISGKNYDDTEEIYYNNDSYTYIRLMQNYLSRNCEGTMTVAHNGTQPKAIDMII